jgi:hypothetical protein
MNKFSWSAVGRSKIVEEKAKELFGVSNFEEIKLELSWLKTKHRNTFDTLEAKLKRTKDKIKEDID